MRRACRKYSAGSVPAVPEPAIGQYSPPMDRTPYRPSRLRHLPALPQGPLAAGVTVLVDTADASTKVVYTNGTLPDPNATATDASGTALVFNVPPGPFALTAKVAALDEVFATFPARVNAGEIAHLIVPPLP